MRAALSISAYSRQITSITKRGVKWPQHSGLYRQNWCRVILTTHKSHCSKSEQLSVNFWKPPQYAVKSAKHSPTPTRHKKICSNFTSIIFKKSKFWIFQFWHVRHCPNDPKLWKEPWGAYRVPKICSNFTPHQLWKIQILNFSIFTGASLAKWSQTWVGTWWGL